MFPLAGKEFPTTTDELTTAIQDALAEVFTIPKKAGVSAEGTYASIKRLTVDLSGTIAKAPATDPFGRERLGLRLETSIDRTEYGVSWNAPNQSGGDYLANEVKLIAELALLRAEG